MHFHRDCLHLTTTRSLSKKRGHNSVSTTCMSQGCPAVAICNIFGMSVYKQQYNLHQKGVNTTVSKISLG